MAGREIGCPLLFPLRALDFLGPGMPALPNEAEFFRFMENNGPPSDGGKRNYLSWLRYVAEQYSPDFSALTVEGVAEISRKLTASATVRTKYKSSGAISDIGSALNKYLAFLATRNDFSELSADVISLSDQTSTTSKTEIEARLGQGKYRGGVIEIWKKCAVTELERVDLLVASHIKPWRSSTRTERLDPFNGLLLCPNLDKLFDRGYIGFSENGKIMTSPRLGERDLKILGISASMRLYRIVDSCIPYLLYHQEHVLIKI